MTARVSLSAALESVGTSLIDIVAGRMTGARTVSGLSIYDPADSGDVSADAILLGVGVIGEQEVRELVSTAIALRAAAVVVRQPVAADPATLHAASQAGMVVLGLTAGVDWGRLSIALGRALEPPPLDLAGSSASASGRLGQIADTLGELLDAPITIEDSDSRVLAFSHNQDVGDASRKEAILVRAVPRVYTDFMRSTGIFRRIYAHDRPVRFEIDELYNAELPRTVMRVVSGGVVCGSIWVARQRPLDELELESLRRTAHEISGLLDLLNREGDREAQRRRQIIGQLLTGDGRAQEQARQIGPVLGIVLLAPADGSEPLSRLADMFSLHLGNHTRGGLAAEHEGTVVGVVPLEDISGDAIAMRITQQFIDHSARLDGLCAVVGQPAGEPRQLAQCYADARRTLRILQQQQGGSAARIVRTEDAYFDVVLAEVRARLGENWAGFRTPLRRLQEYDREHGTDLVPTLAEHLGAFGNIARAAEAMHVHPNTFRYRLRRIAEISGIDVEDQESRFRAELELLLCRDPQNQPSE